MALIKCKDCGKEVSKNADSCPVCGNNIQLQIEEEKAKEFERKQEQKEHWRSIGELCPWCEEHSKQDICPKCKKSKSEYEKSTKCPYCGEYSVDEICPKCGKDKTLMQFWTIAILAIFVILIVILFVQSCSSGSSGSSSSSSSSSSNNEELLKRQACSNRSNTYYKCSWSIFEGRCVCKQR